VRVWAIPMQHADNCPVRAASGPVPESSLGLVPFMCGTYAWHETVLVDCTAVRFGVRLTESVAFEDLMT
jgi:hypothetical protein